VAVVGFERWRIKTTGRMIDNTWVMIFTVKNGKVTRIRVFEDTAKIVAALRGTEGRC
jgi:ketosteroid isomerase-like protein